MNARLNGIRLQVIQGDILTLPVEAIVISATPHLTLDATVDFDARLQTLAGPKISDELTAIGRAEYGDAVVTSAGNLPSKYIIHAIGPDMGTGSERGKLSSAVWKALNLTNELGVKTVAFSPISIGRFGYPIEGCANVMAQKIIDYTFEDLSHLESITVLVAGDGILPIFESAFNKEVRIAQDEAGAMN